MLRLGRVVCHPAAVMPSIKQLSIRMLDTVATCMTTLIIHVITPLVINLSKYLMASTYKRKHQSLTLNRYSNMKIVIIRQKNNYMQYIMHVDWKPMLRFSLQKVIQVMLCVKLVTEFNLAHTNLRKITCYFVCWCSNEPMINTYICRQYKTEAYYFICKE